MNPKSKTASRACLTALLLIALALPLSASEATPATSWHDVLSLLDGVFEWIGDGLEAVLDLGSDETESASTDQQTPDPPDDELNGLIEPLG